MEACRDIRANPFTALSFPSLYSWKDTYGLAIAGDADFFVVRSQHDQAYYCPCGDERKCRAFIEDVCGREKEPRFLYLTRDQGERMKKDGFFTLLRDDLSEYIASASAVALTQGHHITHSFRIKIHHFQRDTAYSVRFITEQDLPALRRFAREAADASSDMGDWNVVNTLRTTVRSSEGVKCFFSSARSFLFMGMCLLFLIFYRHTARAALSILLYYSPQKMSTKTRTRSNARPRYLYIVTWIRPPNTCPPRVSSAVRTTGPFLALWYSTIETW